MPSNLIMDLVYNNNIENTAITNLSKGCCFELDRSKIPSNLPDVLNNAIKKNDRFKSIAEYITTQLNDSKTEYKQNERRLVKTSYEYKHDTCFYLSCLNLNKSQYGKDSNLLVISLENSLDLALSIAFPGVNPENIRVNLGDKYDEISRLMMTADVDNIPSRMKFNDLYKLDDKLDDYIRTRFKEDGDAVSIFSSILNLVTLTSFSIITFIYSSFNSKSKLLKEDRSFSLLSRTNNKLLYETNLESDFEVLLKLHFNVSSHISEIPCRVYESYEYINNIDSIVGEEGILKC